MTEAKKHAQLSPSGAHRWMACAGSVAMEDGLPNKSSTYARQGTAAHTVASLCLTVPNDPAAYLGRVFTVEGEDFECDAEMVGAVRTYVNAVLARVNEYKLAGAVSVELHVEQEVPVDHITGEEGATGTADAIIIAVFADGAVIDVWDLKYGMGVPVSAVENEQAQLYALGAIRKFEFAAEFTKVRVNIHQPRLSDTASEWDRTIAEIDTFADVATIAARDALTLLKNKKDWMGTSKALSALNPGDSQCQFCSAKATCPALADRVQETIGASFEELGAPINDEYSKTPQLKAHAEKEYFNSLTPTDLKQLGTKLKAVSLIEMWCKAIRAKVEAALFEQGNSDAAIAQLGHKLVQGKRGNRAWKDEADAEKVFKSFRLKQEQMYSFKLISPTAAEKLLTGQDKRWAKVQPLIGQADGQPSVAPASDKRPALVIKPVADSFTDLSGDVGDLA